MHIERFFQKFNPRWANFILFCYLIFKVAVIDQVTKRIVIDYFHYTKDHHPILPFINIIEAYNHGISFGMFSDASYSNILFSLIAVIICTVCFVIFIRENTFVHASAFGFIIGGAVGNLIDRYDIGAVFDFIDFHVGGWHFATFNFADAAIVTGVIILLVSNIDFFNKKLTH